MRGLLLLVTAGAVWLLSSVVLGGCVRAGFGPPDSQGGGDLDAGPTDTLNTDVVFDALDAGPCTWTPFSTPAPIPSVNTPAIEWAPHLSSDRLTLYFTSDRAGGSGNTDVWTATRATVNQPFGAPSNLKALNTPGNEEDPATSADGLEIYHVWGGVIVRSARLLVTASFTLGTEVTGLVPTSKTHARGPFLAADGLTLYYQVCTNVWESCDLAVATRPSSGASFSHLRTLDELNTAKANDGWPTVSANQLELYFEGNNRAVSGARVYVATRSAVSAPFGPATLVKELVVGAASGDPDLSRDGTTMVLSGHVTGSSPADVYIATRTCVPRTDN